MRRDSEREILENELLYPSRGRRRDDDDDGDDEYPPGRGGGQRKSFGEMREQFRSDGRRAIKVLDGVLKTPDRICRGIEDFCSSFSKSMGNSGGSKGRRRKKRR